MSSADWEISLLRSRKKPKRLKPVHLDDIGLTLIPSYDSQNDIFAVDFDLAEEGADLPEPDGRLVWKISRHNGSVIGFFILGAKAWGLAGLTIDIAARKEGIEDGLRRLPPESLWGQITKTLIERVAVTAYARKNRPAPNPSVVRGLNKAIDEFNSLLHV